MKQTILSENPGQAKKKLSRLKALCLFTAILTLAGNVLLFVCCTETTRVFCMLANILTDVLAGFLIVYVTVTSLLPGRLYLRLMRQQGEAFSCRVEGLSENTLRYMDLDCYEVATDTRTLFLPAHTLCLQPGKTYCFRTTSGIITEAEE